MDVSVETLAVLSFEGLQTVLIGYLLYRARKLGRYSIRHDREIKMISKAGNYDTSFETWKKKGGRDHYDGKMQVSQ